jgi:hypothetical protein
LVIFFAAFEWFIDGWVTAPKKKNLLARVVSNLSKWFIMMIVDIFRNQFIRDWVMNRISAREEIIDMAPNGNRKFPFPPFLKIMY